MTNRSKRAIEYGILLCAVLLCFSVLFGCTAPPLPEASSDPDIASLMGETQSRQALAARIAKSGHTWQEYSAWGKELATQGFVKNPPTGPAPSPKLSNFFVCTDCHNLAREDPVLTVQDPEARLAYLEQSDAPMFLTQGTTFWGMANRVAFYNGYYAQYHDLCVPEITGDTNVPNGGPDKNGNCKPGTRKMNPASLEDAIQVCSAYCSEGRYMLRWEMDALLAYLWDNQVYLSDLGLSPVEQARVRATLLPPSQERSQVEALREFLATKYLRRAGDTYRDMPALRENADGTFAVGAYQDDETFVGDRLRGQRVYERACLHCHGTPIMPLKGAGLIGNVPLYYHALAKGLPGQDSPYMPEYTLQRLSRQQAADIQAYLESLGE